MRARDHRKAQKKQKKQGTERHRKAQKKQYAGAGSQKGTKRSSFEVMAGLSSRSSVRRRLLRAQHEQKNRLWAKKFSTMKPAGWLKRCAWRMKMEDEDACVDEDARVLTHTQTHTQTQTHRHTHRHTQRHTHRLSLIHI